MGVSVSCPFSKCSELEISFDSVSVKSVNFRDGEINSPVRLFSFDGQHSEPKLLKDRLEEIHTPTTTTAHHSEEIDLQSPSNSPNPDSEPNNLEHVAALKLQKVYKSFRTRRKLADCAVLVEQSWWKLLDFAELKHSSISFFHIEKHESAISRWSRARIRAAKVGKGLSRDGKAQKLAVDHWLEAIDPRHRYGHNLHLYYDQWLHCQSREPFFYWLDIGEGREVNIEKSSRFRLQQQCVKYLGPMERLAYEVIVVDGKFQYKQSGDLLDTTDGNGKWIFVLSTSKTLYVGKKKKGAFHHSSFLSGGATSAAGRIIVEHGILKAVWPHSGHYRPTEENFNEFISFLKDRNVDVSDLQTTPAIASDDYLSLQRSSSHRRSNSFEEELMEHINSADAEEMNELHLVDEKENLREKGNCSPAMDALPQGQLQSFGSKFVDATEGEFEPVETNCNSFQMESLTDGDGIVNSCVLENHDTIPLHNMFDEQHDDKQEEIIPEESIPKRIESHKESRSYQLEKQLSCKGTIGAGPRIGWVRDYPSGLEFHALEQVSLSRTQSLPLNIAAY